MTAPLHTLPKPRFARLLSFISGCLLDKCGRPFGISVVCETDDRRIPSTDGLGHKKAQFGSSVRNRLCDLVRQTGLIIAFDEESRDSRGGKPRPCGGSRQLLSRIDLDSCFGLIAGKPIRHPNAKIRPGLCKRLKRLGTDARLVLGLFRQRDMLFTVTGIAVPPSKYCREYLTSSAASPFAA